MRAALDQRMYSLSEDRRDLARFMGYRMVDVDSSLFEDLAERGIGIFPAEAIESGIPGGGLGVRAVVADAERADIDPWGIYAVGQYVGIQYPEVVISGHQIGSNHPILGPYQSWREFSGIVGDQSVALGDEGFSLASVCNHSELPNASIVTIKRGEEELLVLMAYGWAVRARQELFINYTQKYFSQGVLPSSLLSIGGNFCQKIIDDFKFLLDSDAQNVLQGIDLNQFESRSFSLTESDFSNVVKLGLIGQLKFCLAMIFSSSAMYRSYVKLSKEFTSEQKKCVSRYVYDPCIFSDISGNIDGTVDSNVDYGASVDRERHIVERLLKLKGMPERLLAGDWDYFVSHPLVVKNVSLPFKELEIDFSDLTHRLFLSKAPVVIRFLLQVVHFEVLPFDKSMITERLSATSFFWLNIEHELRSSLLLDREVSFFHTESFLTLLTRFDYFKIHDSELQKILSLLTEEQRLVISDQLGEISGIKATCAQLIKESPVSKFGSKSLQAAVAKLYLACTSALSQVAKDLSCQGQRCMGFKSREVMGKIFRNYTAQWKRDIRFDSALDSQHSIFMVRKDGALSAVPGQLASMTLKGANDEVSADLHSKPGLSLFREGTVDDRSQSVINVCDHLVFKIGDEVVIDGLKKQTHLNNKQGVIVGLRQKAITQDKLGDGSGNGEADHRFIVEIDDGSSMKKILIKVSNLLHTQSKKEFSDIVRI